MAAPDLRMSSEPSASRERLSLADALDRILHRGVALQGDLTIGLADVDLLFLDLRLLLGSIDTIWPDGAPAAPLIDSPTSPSSEEQPSNLSTPPKASAAANGEASSPLALAAREAPTALRRECGPREEGSSTAQGLVRLVLTLVRLLHDVLERQAVRRMEAGRLTDAQVENLGAALFAQAEEIAHLQHQFGFLDKDLSLELGVPRGAL
jgi:Gas vesicle protein K/Gas vesicle protein